MSEALDPIEPEDVASVPNEGTDDDQQDTSLSAEDRALAMGWTPQTQFKGDPEKWVDAETYVKRGEDFLPLLKANNRRLEKALDRTRADMKQLADHHSKTAQREYQRAYADIQRQLDEAAQAGDVQGVRDATDALVDLSKEAAPKVNNDADRLQAEWEVDNPWFKTDRVMAAAAEVVASELIESGLGGKALGLEITKRIKAEFPHKFSNPNRRLPGAVEAGGAIVRRGGKTRSDLPAGARGFMDRMVKQGHMTEAEYLRDYQWS